MGLSQPAIKDEWLYSMAEEKAAGADGRGRSSGRGRSRRQEQTADGRGQTAGADDFPFLLIYHLSFSIGDLPLYGMPNEN